MMTIKEYPLQICRRQTLTVPENETFLSVISRDGVLYIYAEVDTDDDDHEVEIMIFGTDEDTGEDDRVLYVDSVQHGPQVWHVFEVLQ